MTVRENPDTRYELKQAYSDLLLPELRSWVQVHPAGFRMAYPVRQVNSFYFDTHDLDTFNDHISGVPIRQKLRYRWYGKNLDQAQMGQMEVKIKSEQAGWKIVEKLDAEFRFHNASWAILVEQMRAASSGLVRELLSVSRPVVLTVYQREYFVSANGLVRLTIDSNLRGFDQYFSACPNIRFPNPADGQLIIELKSAVSQAAELGDVLAHFPARANRYSKFVTNVWRGRG
jgi:hypothetical protein